MSAFLYSLGRAAYRRRKTVIALWLLVLTVVATIALTFSKGFDDNFELPGSESQEALDSLALTFPQVSGAAAQMVVVAADGESIRSPMYEDAIEDEVDAIGDMDRVDAATSPYSEDISGAISDDNSAAIVSIQLDGDVADLGEPVKADMEEAASDLQAQLPSGSEVSVGGELFTVQGVQLSIVEAVGVVIALVVLLFTLGSLRAAGMPLATAILGVGISVMLIVAGTIFFTINSTTLMLALMLGLAVGIDYALFILSRHRDQLAEGMDPEESAARSVATSGSAVVFAGLTVMIALSGLAVAGIPFLTVMGLAASLAVAIAVMIALTMLPALLGFAGDKLRPRKIRQALAEGRTPPPLHGGFASRFYRFWVGAATRIPALTVIVVVLGLGVFIIPAQNLQLALPTNATAEEGTPARETYDLIEEKFGPGENGPLIMTADIISSTDPLGDMDDLAEQIKDVEGVKDVPLATPNENADTGIVQIVPTTGPDDPATADLVERLRGMAPEIEDEYGFETAVTGYNAVAIDVSERLSGALLPFGILVVGLSLVLLTMVFRSILVPIKATLGYLLSVVTAFGVTALVFEEGFGAEALGVERLGPVISFLPIILMGVLFGLAMDYQLFLVSRIAEDYVHNGDSKQAVKAGFSASAPVVTAAAVIMFGVFGAFVPAGEPIIKSIALALAVGVFVDAFIVRMIFVPALLTLLGDAAWWLPKWLDRILPRFDVEGEGLAHQLSLRDWPEPDSSRLVYAEGLSMGSRGHDLFSGVSLSVGPGEALVVSGRPRTALLLGLTGRAAFSGGEIKVVDKVLPEQSRELRAAVGYASLDRREGLPVASGAELRGLARQVDRGKVRLVVIDHADQPADQDTIDAMRTLVRAVSAHGAGLVLGAGEYDALEPLLDGVLNVRTFDLDAYDPDTPTLSLSATDGGNL